MDSIVGDEAEQIRSMESIVNELRSLSGEALAEWKPFEQVENGMPSTAQSYLDTDDDDDDDDDTGVLVILTSIRIFVYLWSLISNIWVV